MGHLGANSCVKPALANSGWIRWSLPRLPLCPPSIYYNMECKCPPEIQGSWRAVVVLSLQHLVSHSKRLVLTNKTRCVWRAGLGVLQGIQPRSRQRRLRNLTTGKQFILGKVKRQQSQKITSSSYNKGLIPLICKELLYMNWKKTKNIKEK